MKAIVQDAYGPPSVLEFRDIDVPMVGDDEVLLRVRSASAHVGDWHVMTGLPYLIRIVVPDLGLRAPRGRVRGMDVAGHVEEVGKNVAQFRPGDEVFGICKGAFAELAIAERDKLAPKPDNLTFDQAATVPISGLAALQAVRDKGHVQPGQKVLIIGAAGAVGTFAVQIAKAFGAHVTGVCSTSRMELVRSLGADEVIDYTREDFSQNGLRYDAIFDTAGARSISLLRRSLMPTGALVIVGSEGGGRWFGGFGRNLWAQILSAFVSHRLGLFASREKGEDLVVLKELIEAGKVAPVIGATYRLSEVPEAMRHLEKGHARGKIVITV